MERLILKKAGFVCLVAVLLLMPYMVSQASSATMTDLVTFTASNFSASGGTVPTDPVQGSFTITFDPTQSYPIAGTTTGITLNTLNIALGSALSFSYNDPTSGFPADTLVVGGIFDNPSTVQYSPATDDFWLFINNFTSADPAFDQVGYAQVAAGNYLFYTDSASGGTGSVTVTPVTAPVPLPPTALLFGSGLLGLVGLRRFRKS